LVRTVFLAIATFSAYPVRLGKAVSVSMDSSSQCSFSLGDFRRAPASAWARLHQQFAIEELHPQVVLTSANKDPALATFAEKRARFAGDGSPPEGCLAARSMDTCSPLVHRDCQDVSSGSFAIAVDRSKGEQLGIDVESDNGVAPWLIESINGGLVGAWNNDHPDRQVQVGDSIVAANGMGDGALIDECMKLQVLILQILPQKKADKDAALRAPPVFVLPQSSKGDCRILHFSRHAPLPLDPLDLASSAEAPKKSPLANSSPMNSPPAHWPCSPFSPNWSSITAAVAESPITLSETLGDSPIAAAGSQVAKGVSFFSQAGKRILDRLALTTSFRGLHKTQITAGSGGTRKRVQHGLTFVKSKAKRVVLKTRRSLETLPGHALRSKSTTVLYSAPSELELAKDKVHQSMLDIVDIAKGNFGELKDQAESVWSEAAQKRLDYANARAVSVSARLEVNLERISKTALQKGFEIAKGYPVLQKGLQIAFPDEKIAFPESPAPKPCNIGGA